MSPAPLPLPAAVGLGAAQDRHRADPVCSDLPPKERKHSWDTPRAQGSAWRQQGAATTAGLGVGPVRLLDAPPLRGVSGTWPWVPTVPTRPRWAPGGGQTRHRGDAAHGQAGAAVRTRNYGFRLPRGRWECRRATLPAWRAKHRAVPQALPCPARQVPRGRQHWQGHRRAGQAGEWPRVVPQSRFPRKHTRETHQRQGSAQLLLLGSSALPAGRGTEKARKPIIFGWAAALCNKP